MYTRTDEQKIRQKERINQGHFLTLAHHSWFGETVLVPRRFFLFSSAGVAHLCLFGSSKVRAEVSQNRNRNKSIVIWNFYKIWDTWKMAH